MRWSENLNLPLLDSQDLVQRSNINALAEALDEKLLKDTTAALYGFGKDAVPDNVFKRLVPALDNTFDFAFEKITESGT